MCRIFSCREQAADVPIVKLNPLNILTVKAEGEKELREVSTSHESKVKNELKCIAVCPELESFQSFSPRAKHVATFMRNTRNSPTSRQTSLHGFLSPAFTRGPRREGQSCLVEPTHPKAVASCGAGSQCFSLTRFMIRCERVLGCRLSRLHYVILRRSSLLPRLPRLSLFVFMSVFVATRLVYRTLWYARAG